MADETININTVFGNTIKGVKKLDKYEQQLEGLQKKLTKVLATPKGAKSKAFAGLTKRVIKTTTEVEKLNAAFKKLPAAQKNAASIYRRSLKEDRIQKATAALEVEPSALTSGITSKDVKKMPARTDITSIAAADAMKRANKERAEKVKILKEEAKAIDKAHKSAIKENKERDKSKAKMAGNTKSIFNFSRAMGSLSLLFAGQMVMKQMLTLINTSTAFYNQMVKGQTEASRGLIALSAHWQFLRFSIGEAIGTMLLGFLPAIIQIITKINEFAQQHPKLIGQAIAFTLIGGTAMWALAQVVLLGSGIVNLAGAKSGKELVGMFYKGGKATDLWGRKIDKGLIPSIGKAFAAIGPVGWIIAAVTALLAISVGLWAKHPGAIKKTGKEVGIVGESLKGMATQMLKMIGHSGDINDAWTWIAAGVSWVFSYMLLNLNTTIQLWTVIGTVIGTVIKGAIAGWVGLFGLVADWFKFIFDKYDKLHKILGISDKVNIFDDLTLMADDFGNAADDIVDNIKDSLITSWKEIPENLNIEQSAKLLKTVAEGPRGAYEELKAAKESVAKPVTPVIGDPFTPVTGGQNAGAIGGAVLPINAATEATKEFKLQTLELDAEMTKASNNIMENYGGILESTSRTIGGTENLGAVMAFQTKNNILPNLANINTEENNLLDTMDGQSISMNNLNNTMLNYVNTGIQAELDGNVRRKRSIDDVNNSYSTTIKKLERIKTLQQGSSSSGGSEYSSSTGTNSYPQSFGG